MEPPEEPVAYRRALMRHKVERVAHQVAVQHRDGGSPGAFDQMGERGEVSLLALVQPQGSGGFDQRLGLGHRARVVGQGEHPGFSQICHREVGGGLTCCVEQADGVAMDEVERPYGLVVRGDGPSRRAREVMSLGVLNHGWLHFRRKPSPTQPLRAGSPLSRSAGEGPSARLLCAL